MKLFTLAYVAGLLPLLTINITYLVAASHNQVDWCVPYLESCTSISATGRLPPASFVFKSLMIPAAILLAIYWQLNSHWLDKLGSSFKGSQRAIAILGAVAAAALIMHAVFLGATGADYRKLRHLGVFLFSGLTLAAQVLLTRLLNRLASIKIRFGRQLFWLSGLLLMDLLLGVASVMIQLFDANAYDAISDAFAWNFILLLCLHNLLIADLWRKTA